MNRHTMTIRYMDRKGGWHTETGPVGYMNSRIVGLTEHNQYVEVVRPSSLVGATYDVQADYRERYWQEQQSREWAKFANEQSWEEAARLDQIQADREAGDLP